ncbi:MAG: PilZ domain-containing protein [Myxococcota bacterium]
MAERAERHHVELKLVYDDGTTFSTGRVRDVSDTGLFIETAAPAPVGTVLQLFPVDQEAGELFEIDAEVVRVEEDNPDTSTLGGMGLRFNAQASDLAAIHRLIEALEMREQKTVTDPFLGLRIPAPMPESLRIILGTPDSPEAG